MFETAIFDFDGTLADTKHAIVASFQNALKQIQCDVNDEFILRLIGTGAKNTFREALKAARVQFNDEMLEELVKKKVQTGVELAGTVELFEGAVNLLNSLRGKVKLALASMNNREIIDKILEEKKIKTYFDVIITADEVCQPKPHPEIFLKCAIALRCPPEKYVVIEDSVFGVEAAKKAKMKCIAVPTGARALPPRLICRHIIQADVWPTASSVLKLGGHMLDWTRLREACTCLIMLNAC